MVTLPPLEWRSSYAPGRGDLVKCDVIIGGQHSAGCGSMWVGMVLKLPKRRDIIIE